jgi:hypothetical protein
MANLDQYGQPLRDPASAVLQRKYALAQALQKQGMDTSPSGGHRQHLDAGHCAGAARRARAAISEPGEAEAQAQEPAISSD